jgi:WD40 repeat protein
MRYEAEGGGNAESDEFNEKLQMTVEVDARAANIRDPPLVAATRLEESPPIVEAIAVAASESQQESESEVYQETGDSNAAAAATRTLGDADAVEDDYQRLEQQSNAENIKKGEAAGSDLKRPHLMIGLLAMICLLIGAAVGVGIAVGGSKNRNAANTSESPIITVADAVSASPSMISSPSPELMLSLSPTRSPKSCIDSFNLTLSRELDDLRTASSPLPFRRQRTLPSAGQYVIARDGATLVVDEYGAFLAGYDLTNDGNEVERTEPMAEVNAIALSDDGVWLAVGSGMIETAFADASVPFAPGGSLIFYQRNKINNWELVHEIGIGGGAIGGVFQVDINDDGSTISFLGGLGGDESIMFVQVYSNTENAVLLPLGNVLFEDWINYNTTTGIVDERLFVCSTDGFIRAYDLVEGAWQQLGDSIPHDESHMFLATGDKTRLITASLVTGIDAFELQDSKWQPLDLRTLNEQVSSVNLTSIAVSSDGNAILVTETLETNGDVILLGLSYLGQLFERVGNEYQLSATLQFGHPAEVQTTQITEEGDVMFVLDIEVLYYNKIQCEA